MTQAAKAQEPSMEEILASIRRIIADDDAGKPAEPKPAEPAKPVAAPVAAAPAPAPGLSQKDVDAVLAGLDAPPARPVQPAEADVLDLTEAMQAAAPPPPSFQTIDAQSDIVFSTRPASAAEHRAPEEPKRPARSPAMPDLSLMSATTSAAVDSAFNTLAGTILGQNSRTLEDLVKEMLRPMLKTWLDDNLPSLVERIVRAEIERVSRGRM